MSLTLNELATHLNGTVRGEPETLLNDIASFENAKIGHVTYAESKKQITAISKCHASAIITSQDLAALIPDCSTPLLIVAKPQSAFIKAMLTFRPEKPSPPATISPKAIISDTAVVGANCHIGPGVIIGENVKLGDRCRISAGVVIGDDCELGVDCFIHPGVVFYANVKVADRVLIHANAVIGGDGFGFRFENGNFIKIPHTGRVIIEDDVEIGACTTIDRGMIESTVIGQGTKIDNQVMIAHNCKIGRYNAFASQVGLAGSVTTGDYVQMGGKTGIADHITIGTQVKLGGNSGVLADILQPGTYYDSPAVPEVDALKNHINIKRIPELRDQVKQLKSQLATLQKELVKVPAPSETQVSDVKIAA